MIEYHLLNIEYIQYEKSKTKSIKCTIHDFNSLQNKLVNSLSRYSYHIDLTSEYFMQNNIMNNGN